MSPRKPKQAHSEPRSTLGNKEAVRRATGSRATPTGGPETRRRREFGVQRSERGRPPLVAAGGYGRKISEGRLQAELERLRQQPGADPGAIIALENIVNAIEHGQQPVAEPRNSRQDEHIDRRVAELAARLPAMNPGLLRGLVGLAEMGRSERELRRAEQMGFSRAFVKFASILATRKLTKLVQEVRG